MGALALLGVSLGVVTWVAFWLRWFDDGVERDRQRVDDYYARHGDPNDRPPIVVPAVLTGTGV